MARETGRRWEGCGILGRMSRASSGLLSILVFLAACSDSEGGSTTDDRCQEPKFVADTPVDWAPCGCGAEQYGERTQWEDACLSVPNHTCLSGVHGGTCSSKCVLDSDCPPHSSGLTPSCSKSAGSDPSAMGTCILPCDEGAIQCPEGFICDVDTCLHDFQP